LCLGAPICGGLDAAKKTRHKDAGKKGAAKNEEVHRMRCPYCRHADSRVVDSREAEDGQIIRRRRSCPECGRRFTTVEEAVLAVVKRSGVTEPFSRTKIVAGVRKACQGRPVDEDAIALLAQKVEETVRARGSAEIPSHEVGLAILEPLRHLDEVAYLRFASVYRSFESLGDFEREIAALREAGRTQAPATTPTKATKSTNDGTNDAQRPNMNDFATATNGSAS
jgi:transcriptional repressor NrdR